MASNGPPARSMPMPTANPPFRHPSSSSSPSPIPTPRAPQSPPDSTRRHSLPLHFLPPNLWSSNTSSASLVETEEAARGEHILDEATAAHRISALRQLNGATRGRHRYAKSTGARNSTFNQPVIVRTYSGTLRPPSQQRDIITIKKENGVAAMSKNTNRELKLPPVEAFSFKGIMDEIKHGVAEDLERIAEICARSRYSLSNQYEVHMPPHGRGEPILQTVGHASGSQVNAAGPTLQAIGSDDEQPRYSVRTRGIRRTKSAAYGTLETIMSSSKSSDEDKSKKKPAAEIAEEVRGRAARKEPSPPQKSEHDCAIETGPTQQKPKHVRSKSATFAAVMMDNAQSFTHDTKHLVSPSSLVSEPARPQTFTAADYSGVPEFGESEAYVFPNLPAMKSSKSTMIRNESTLTNLRPESDGRSLFRSFSSWLPWSGSSLEHRMREVSHAEGSLRDLLKSTEAERKGKRVERSS